MNKTCEYCGSDNTVKTEEQHLDTMRDYFCNDCDKDFTHKKSMKLHKLTKDKVGPRVYTLPWEGFRYGGEEFDYDETLRQLLGYK
jgi:transposase-like protein